VAVALAGTYANLHLDPDKITMPASHHLGFYSPDALPAAQPTASKIYELCIMNNLFICPLLAIFVPLSKTGKN